MNKLGCIFVALLASGCVTSTPPPPIEMTSSAGSDRHRDGMVYSLSQTGDAATLSVLNAGAASARLLPESAVIDARGRRYAIAPASLEPQSMLDVLVPPKRETRQTTFDPADLTGEIGGYDRGGVYSGRRGGEPSASAPAEFSWRVGATVRVELVWRIQDQTVRHDFTLVRPRP
jgi:hypothetical protein